MLKKSFLDLFQPADRKTRLPGLPMFHGLKPFTARSLPKDRVFQQSAKPDQTTLIGLAFAVLLAVVPHFWHLSTSIVVYSVILIGWHLLATKRYIPLPSRWFLPVLTVLGGCAVIAQSDGVLGREAGTGLFIVGLSLKLLELHTTRDFYLTVFLVFLVVITQYLYNQELPMLFYSLGIVILPVTLLVRLNSRSQLPFPDCLKIAGQLMVLSIPLTIGFFILFPRLPGPLWRLPDDHGTARAGLSDTVEPGSISRLGMSDALVFRASFFGEPPPMPERYWRGPVFWHTDGVHWTLEPEPKVIRDAIRPAAEARRYGYRMIIESSRENWITALDWPSVVPHGVHQIDDLGVRSPNGLSERVTFTFESVSAMEPWELSNVERELALQLPQTTPQRILDLVHAWQANGSEETAIVGAALNFFKTENFVYTLNPPLLAESPIERFLFETRRGFCEHYATAFVYLMRVAGIPARLVTGYHGGIWNDLGRFIEVRQADAHAWAEVWLGGSGWIRVDPTAAIAPERIERGLDLQAQLSTGEIAFGDWRVAADELPFARMLSRQLLTMWSSLDHIWQLWVLAYGPEQQERLLAWLGVLDWHELFLIMSGLAGLALGIVGWIVLRPKRRNIDPVLGLYDRFCCELAKFGFERRPTEGPSAYLERIASARPDWKTSLEPIFGLYIELRYGAASPLTVHALRKRWKQFQSSYLRGSRLGRNVASDKPAHTADVTRAPARL